MKNKLIYLLLVMAIIATMGIVMTEIIHKNSDIEAMKGKDNINIVTTIYPVYLIGLNLADQTDHIEVTSLINRNTGCLHDYQLTAEDMKVIASADILVINGGGMESFLEDIKANYPDLKIIDASKDISMIPNGEAAAGEGSADSLKEGIYNSHVWLDPELYAKQIENVRDGIIDYIKKIPYDTNSDADSISHQISKNAERYIDKVQKLNVDIQQYSKKVNGNSTLPNYQEAVIFHEAFAYLANKIGMKIAFSVEIEPDTSLSAGNIANIVREVKNRNIKYLFTEEQYSDAIPRQIAEETKAQVYVIDSIVTGDGSKDSYLKAMQNNLNILQEAANRSGK